MFTELFMWPFMAAFFIVKVIIGIILFVFWITMIIDCAQRKFRNSDEKIVWLVVTILGEWVGALAYYLVVRISNPQGLSRKAKK